MRLLRLLCCAAAFIAFVALPARADEWNKLTYLTFSGPVQVPGTTLPAGTYMFKLADTMTNRHVVQVYDKAGKKLFATMLAIPDERLEPAGKNIVLFAERPSGSPQAVKAWWYPGDTIGDEFVYPRSQALRIARDTHQPVLSMADKGSSDREKMRTAEVARVDENGATKTMETPATTAQAKQAPRSTAQAEPAPAPTTTARPATTTGTAGHKAPAATDTARRLPATGSNLPLAELLAGLALAGAFGARQLRKRLASVR
jgi:hypothetical protein